MGISTNQQRIYFFCRVYKIGNVKWSIMDLFECNYRDFPIKYIYIRDMIYLISRGMKSMFSDDSARVGTCDTFYGYGTVGTVGTVRWVRWVRYGGYGGCGTVGTGGAYINPSYHHF